MNKPLTKRQAELLHREIRDGLLNIEKKIAEFAQRQGYLALGYKTFADYWADRMSDVALRQTEALNIVSYVMFEEGATDEDVAKTIKGISPTRVRAIREHKSLGVPAKKVPSNPETILVREHERKAFRAPDQVVHVKVRPSTYKRYKSIAKRAGTTLEEAAEMALRLYFAELASRSERGAA